VVRAVLQRRDPGAAREEILADLDDIKTAVHDRFPGARARLDQLDSHLATVRMVVEHIHEEAARAAEGN
jgi:hypothetical protein